MPEFAPIANWLPVTFPGHGFLQASAHARIANLVTNTASLVVHGIHGELLVGMGLVMGATNVIGGLAGARMAVRRGSGFVRKVFLMVMGILVVTLAAETVGNLS